MDFSTTSSIKCKFIYVYCILLMLTHGDKRYNPISLIDIAPLLPPLNCLLIAVVAVAGWTVRRRRKRTGCIDAGRWRRWMRWPTTSSWKWAICGTDTWGVGWRRAWTSGWKRCKWAGWWWTRRSPAINKWPPSGRGCRRCTTSTLPSIDWGGRMVPSTGRICSVPKI